MASTVGDLAVFAGSASPRFGAALALALGAEFAEADVERFPDGNVLVSTPADVAGRPCVVVQSVVFPADERFMELVFWVDALRRGGAASVTVAMPYFGYGKADRVDVPGGSLRARVCAEVLEAAGAAQVLTFDLHSPQVQGFFRVPLDELTALPALAAAIASDRPAAPGLVVVAPDLGAVRRARRFAEHLAAPLLVADKRRLSHAEPEVVDLLGSQDVAGRPALIVDDFVLTGGTLAAVAERLRAAGASRIGAAVTHGLFVPYTIERLETAGIDSITVTDTVENQPAVLPPMVRVVSVVPLLAAALRRRSHTDTHKHTHRILREVGT